MKKKVIIFNALIMCSINISNIINYKTSNIEEVSKKITKQNIGFKRRNFLASSIDDVISAPNVDFSHCCSVVQTFYTKI